MGFLRTIVIIVMIYYIIKIVSRFMLPIFAKKMVQKMEDKIRQQQGYEKQDNSKVGETVIDKKPQDKTSKKNVGEYIDYEEVD